MPLLSAAAETRETWAMVARGAVKGVSLVREAARTNEVPLGEERLGISLKGACEGDSWIVLAAGSL